MSVLKRLEIFALPQVVAWTQILLDSYARWTAQELIPRSGDAHDESQRLFDAPFVVASHDDQIEPILNYGNRAALALWELTWEEFTRLPSRATADATCRAEREKVLAQVSTNGCVHGYSGIRISSTGRRFRIGDTSIWELMDRDGKRVGQAAAFRHWTDA